MTLFVAQFKLRWPLGVISAIHHLSPIFCTACLCWAPIAALSLASRKAPPKWHNKPIIQTLRRSLSCLGPAWLIGALKFVAILITVLTINYAIWFDYYIIINFSFPCTATQQPTRRHMYGQFMTFLPRPTQLYSMWWSMLDTELHKWW